MRVVVTGAGGLLAAAVIRAFSPSHDVVALERRDLDVTDAAAVDRTIAWVRPDIVINCAAYNDVDGAQDDPVRALSNNAIAVHFQARAAERAGAMLVHYGSDFVFDGRAARPYTEGDEPNPAGNYASAKLLGDYFALGHSRAYVLRVESLFGEPGPGGTRQGSLGTIVKRIRDGEPVPAFVDRTVSPSYTTDVAAATLQLVTATAPFGLYHCVNSGQATWAAIATEAARLLNLPIQITPITLETVALKAPRPKYCALSNAKLAAVGIVMPTWQDALRRYLA